MVIAAPEFDTLAHARRLKDAGFDERQAEAAVAMVRHAVTEGVATKADIKVAVAELKTDIAANKADLKAAVAELKTDIAANKADLEAAVAELKTDIAANKADLKAAAAELKTDIAASKTDISAVKWVLGFLAALNVAIVARLFGAF